MPGLFEAIECVVAIRGVEVTTASFRELRRRVHVEIEESVLISCSIADNVRFAQPEALVDEVVWACRFAGLEEFISSLPEGFNTEVGEGAIRLSGRQRQGLAPALPPAAPRGPVLDDASPAIDPSTERRIPAGLRGLPWHPTLLVVSHRPHVVGLVERIVCLEDGCLVADARPCNGGSSIQVVPPLPLPQW